MSRAFQGERDDAGGAETPRRARASIDAPGRAGTLLDRVPAGPTPL